MTDPAIILDRLAAQRGYVTPLPAYFPLGRDFCEEVARLAVAEARAEMAAEVRKRLIGAEGAAEGE